MDDISLYRDLFFEETDEYLQILNECLLQLEKNPEDKDSIDEIFRSAHTLKGMSATMGYKTMAELTHEMENVFELFRRGSSTINSDVMSLIFLCVDKLTEIVEDLRNGKHIDYNIDNLLTALDNISKGEFNDKNKEEKIEFSLENIVITDTDMMIIQDANDKDYYAFNIAVRLSDGCLLKGARAYVVINRLEQQGDILQSEPSPEKLEEGNFDNIFRLIYLSKLSKESIKEIIKGIAEIDDVLIEQIIPDGASNEDMVKKEHKIINEVEHRDEPKNSGHHNISQSIRVDLGKLDSFMNLVSELVIYRTRLEDLSNIYNTKEIKEPLDNVARITGQLQDLVLKIRMQPVNVVFNRFPRMVRDLSRQLNKEIELVIEGEGTELDRTVVSELGEPLVHLIRNAADHGIESVDKRIALNKPKTGLIKLTAHQEGNRVVITINDDGKGIDPMAIKESANKKGINTEEMNNRDLIQLIFSQGFSTAQNVTNVSGRGVGMDVVKQKISSLCGSIEVVSEVNRGTTFIIKLPLTLSIIQTLMVKVGSDTFALPLGNIEKVVKIKHEEIIRTHNDEIYLYNGRVIPVIRVNKKLGILSEEKDKHLVLLLLGEQYYGLLVDGLIGQQEIVIKKLSGVLGKMKEYLGATILGNGEIVLILDIGNLCSERNYDKDE